MSTPSSNDDRPGEGEPGDGTAEPEAGRARDDARAQGEPAAGARADDRADAAGDGDYDPFIAEETEDEEPLDADEHADTDADTGTDTAAAGRWRSDGGVVGAETFAIASVLALAGAMVGPRLVQMFSSVTAQDQVSAVSGTIVGDALVALVGVVLGLLGIGLANEHTRPWARWVSGAAVLLGILFAVLSVVAYLMVPAPTPAPMGPQM